MVEINIPNNFLPERKYIIDILFDEFLGLKYEINIKNKTKDYEIILENGNKIIIKGSFFSNFKDGLNYLDEKNIPEKINFLKNRFIVEKDIPVIFGNDEFKIRENEIVCGIDIFASSFFMLTRWEEYANKTRDLHNRFPVTASLAYKYDFLNRPIVNEYAEMLWNMLKYLWCNQKRKERKYELILTHDVDNIFKWKNFGLFARNIAGDIIKRKSVSLALENIRQYFGNNPNPYDMFDFIMDLSEKRGIKSHFFFMSGGTSKFDNNYSINQPFVKKIREKIKSRGHLMGFHPSYNSYNNQKQWEEEYSHLSKEVSQKVKIGRQHFLRFEVPTTWQIWEDNNMKWDSTLTYPEKEGFRCGTCYEYSVFNILSRKKLKLKEMPLTVMEVTMGGYQNLVPGIMEKKIIKLIDKVKKYNGKFVLLWHNSSFNSEFWARCQGIYEKIVSINKS